EPALPMPAWATVTSAIANHSLAGMALPGGSQARVLEASRYSASVTFFPMRMGKANPVITPGSLLPEPWDTRRCRRLTSRCGGCAVAILPAGESDNTAMVDAARG